MHGMNHTPEQEPRTTPLDLLRRAQACVNACTGMEDPEKEIADMKIRESLHARAVIVCGGLREENQKLHNENDTLRGLLGNSALPCVYCGLPANEQDKCERGFPECPRERIRWSME